MICNHCGLPTGSPLDRACHPCWRWLEEQARLIQADIPRGPAVEGSVSWRWATGSEGA